MIYEIAYLPKALEDYEQSVEWYAERSIRAAENFIEEVRQKIEEIKINPEQFRNQYKNFREATLIRFPFDIVYITETERVLIISIYHKKRNPKRKYRRK